MDSGIDVLSELVIDDPSSIFLQADTKIKSNSIYDNQAKI